MCFIQPALETSERNGASFKALITLQCLKTLHRQDLSTGEHKTTTTACLLRAFQKDERCFFFLFFFPNIKI